MRNVLTGTALFAISLFWAANAAPQNAPRYRVTDLGDLGGKESIASSINSSGQVVGASYLTPPTNACAERRAFLYENGSMVELPSLPGTRYASASAINDLGDVSGTNDVYVQGPNCSGGCFPGYCGVQTPVLVRSGVALDLSAPSPWYAGIAGDVNNAGQVVGWSWNSDLPPYHAYLWEDGARIALGTLGGWSIATDINEQGVVVGYSQDGADSMGFRWQDGQMTALPTLAGRNNHGANEISETGDIVGWSGVSATSGSPGEFEPAFYPVAGGVIGLGTLGGTDGSAFGLNDSGSVVGYSYTAGNQRHAFLYHAGTLWDLNDRIDADSGWELMAATGINNAGEIVGFGCKDGSVVASACVDSNGAPDFRRAFLLTPVSITDLEDLILSLDLPKGLETSLLAKLAAARRALAAGRIQTACALLGSLANEIEAQSGKGLTADEAELLLQTVRLLRADLGCG